MSNTVPVTFDNQDGYKLFGILHKASGNVKRDLGIIILSPGVKSRVAPHRLYVKMAKRFSELGFDVLRFDFYGLGDSEGEINDKFTADFYGSVQVGRYIDDTISAMDWMEKEHKIKKFILAGLCGGAITGLFAGAHDKRVLALLGLGIPVILDGAEFQDEKYLTDGRLENIMGRRYFRNIFKLKKWMRFISFKSDYRLIFSGMIHFAKKKIYGAGSQEADSVNHPRKNEIERVLGNFNRHFPKAMKNMLSSSKKVFLIFSEADRLYWEFNEKYLKYFGEETIGDNNLEVLVTKDANHIFSFTEWQEDMLAKSVSLIKKFNK